MHMWVCSRMYSCQDFSQSVALTVRSRKQALQQGNGQHLTWTCCILYQAALYQACVDAGITLLSIGHRPAIKAFHQAVIHFQVCTRLSATTMLQC
jgi:hypothetical protein